MVDSWHFFEIEFKNLKTNLDFTKIFDNPFTKYPITKVFWMHSLYF